MVDKLLINYYNLYPILQGKKDHSYCIPTDMGKGKIFYLTCMFKTRLKYF